MFSLLFFVILYFPSLPCRYLLFILSLDMKLPIRIFHFFPFCQPFFLYLRFRHSCHVQFSYVVPKAFLVLFTVLDSKILFFRIFNFRFVQMLCTFKTSYLDSLIISLFIFNVSSASLLFVLIFLHFLILAVKLLEFILLFILLFLFFLAFVSSFCHWSILSLSFNYYCL